MPKGTKKVDFPEQVNVRLTVEQMTFLQETALVSGLKPSDLVRSMIQRDMRVEAAFENKKGSAALNEAMAVLQRYYEEVGTDAVASH